MHSKHVKGLIWALAASGFANIIMLTSIIYTMNKEHPPALYCEQKPQHKLVKQKSIIPDDVLIAHIARLHKEPYDALLQRVKLNAPIDNGLSEGFLAVSVLVAFHHFDIARALEGSAYLPQERLLSYGGVNNIPTSAVKIYMGLDDYHLSAITSFAESERWPQTPRGIFFLIQRSKGNFDGSLLDAFYLTAEFMSIEPIFRRTEPALERKEIVSLLIEGDWQTALNLSEQQRLYGDLSLARRRNILQEYASKGSLTARGLLKKLTGELIVSIPKPTILQEAVKATKKEEPKLLASATKSDRLYIVQEGDNLWKLSRRFNVDVDLLRRYNKLTTDALAPGSAIRVPGGL